MNPNAYSSNDYDYDGRPILNRGVAGGGSYGPHSADHGYSTSSHFASSPIQDNRRNPPIGLPTTSGLPAGSYTGHDYDLENQDYYTSDKLTAACDISIRHGFARKVFAIVGIQLLFTFGGSLPFLLIESWKEFLRQQLLACFIIGAILFMIPVFVLSCCRNVSRSFPQNYIWLFVMTIGATMIIAGLGSVTSVASFTIAAGITAAVTIGLIIFAIQTRIDFTSCWTFAFVAMIVLIIFGLLLIFIRSRVLHLIYASLGALLMSFYIVFDTQLIVGGKHRKHEFSIDDYVFAAMSLYLDIVNLFMYLIQILNLTEGN